MVNMAVIPFVAKRRNRARISKHEDCRAHGMVKYGYPYNLSLVLSKVRNKGPWDSAEHLG
jgi:hypothetical protein